MSYRDNVLLFPNSTLCPLSAGHRRIPDSIVLSILHCIVHPIHHDASYQWAKLSFKVRIVGSDTQQMKADIVGTDPSDDKCNFAVQRYPRDPYSTR